MIKVKIDKYGDKEWYKNGNLHREDGPALERANGDKFWYKNGKLHRLGGPAIERKNGDKVWHKNGFLHRTNGPAMEYTSGYKEWWLNGKEVTERDIFPITILGFYKNSFKNKKSEELTFEIF